MKQLGYSKKCINEQWMFAKENDTFTSVDLPHTWNNEDGCTGGDSYHRGLCTYKKTIHVEDDLKDSYIYLEFEGVNSEAHVYVNGEEVGSHRGGYSTFRCHITKALLFGQDNEIRVSVDNAHNEEIYPLMADFTFFGGIYRNVNLIVAKDIHFDLMDEGTDGIYLSQKSISRDQACIGFRGTIFNHGSNKDLTYKIDVYDQESHEVYQHEEVINIKELTTLGRDILIERPHLWQGVEDPYLYTFKISLYVEGILVDEKVLHMGLRYYEVHPQKGFMLNGKPTRLNGVSRHQDKAGKGWALSEEDHLEDMRIIKEIGANSIRLAHYQHSQYFYDLCDKEGMVVWAEIPFISRQSKTDLEGNNAMSQMKELIRQNYNHCSICFWGVQNEITIGGKTETIEAIVNKLNDMTKKEDPYRLTTQAHVGHHPDVDSMNHITDVLAYNRYHGWYYDEVEAFDTWLSDFAEKNPSLSVGISEYGVEGILDYHTDTPEIKDYTEEYHALYHEKVLQIFNKHEQIWGTYVWNMFDFASDFRDEGGVQGMNNKGLVTYDRKTRKDAFYYYKASWSNEPVLHINSKRYVQRLADKITVKVYTNQEKVSLSVNGKLIEEKSSNNHIVEFMDVSLIDGENSILVQAGEYTDEAVFNKVDELTVSYEVPEVSKGSNVQNWFDHKDTLDEDIQEIEFIEGTCRLEDRLSQIVESPEGQAVIDKYLPGITEHGMYDMISGMTMQQIIDFDKKNFTDVLVYNITKDLNRVKKIS